MSNYLSVRLKYGPMISIDSATFTGSYQLLGTVPVPGSIVKMVNDSDKLITISTDGTTDHDVCPAGSFFLYDVTSNDEGGHGRCLPQGTPIYVNGVAGTGLVYWVTLTPGV